MSEKNKILCQIFLLLLGIIFAIELRAKYNTNSFVTFSSVPFDYVAFCGNL